MKHISNNQSLAHVWVNRLHSEARGSNMHFKGDVLYSYSTPVAWRIIEPPMKRRGHPLPERVTYFIDTTSYSRTTSKQLCYVSRALPPGAAVFEGPVQGATTPEQFAKGLLDACAVELARAADLAQRFPRRPSAGRPHQISAVAYQTAAERVKERFNLRLSVSMHKCRRQMQQVRKAVAIIEEADKERSRKYEARRREALADWVAGKPGVTVGDLPVGNTYLRIKEGFVETSRGMRLSIDEARRALMFIRRHREHGWAGFGADSPDQGLAIETTAGRFNLNAVNSAGAVAGCHRISWDEIDRFAATLP